MVTLAQTLIVIYFIYELDVSINIDDGLPTQAKHYYSSAIIYDSLVQNLKVIFTS